MNRLKEKIISRLVQSAAQALQAHKRENAAAFARRVLDIEKDNIDALLILAATCEPAESFQRIKRVLALEPNNQKAREGLVWISAKHGFDTDAPIVLKTEEAVLSPSELDPLLEVKLAEMINGSSDRQRMPLLRRIFTRWQSLLAITLVLVVVLTAALAPMIAPLSEENVDDPYYKIICTKLHCIPQEPSEQYILGTIKEFDVFHTLIWGTRQALWFGLGAALTTAVIGTLLGASSAYIGGWFDRIVMRICDAFMAFPIIAAIAMFAQVITLLGSTTQHMSLQQFEAIPEQPNFIQTFILNTDPVLLALILFSWMPYARIIHAQVLHIRKSEFIEAATAVGNRRSRILFRHILPNALSPAVVTATRDIGRMVVAQASFTFINVGSSSSWALLLNIGKDWIIGPGGNLMTRWWIYLPITLAVVFFGFSWSFLGDEVNVWLNPRNN